MSYLHLILLQHGDIKSNPGPDKTKLKNFSCCHWNVNSLVGHNFSNLCQLKHIIHYITTISIVYLKPILTPLICITMNTYSQMGTVWSDHIILVILKEVVFESPYYIVLTVKIINLSACNECILCEISIENYEGFIAVIYRSQAKTMTNFKNFYLYLRI